MTMPIAAYSRFPSTNNCAVCFHGGMTVNQVNQMLNQKCCFCEKNIFSVFKMLHVECRHSMGHTYLSGDDKENQVLGSF